MLNSLHSTNPKKLDARSPLVKVGLVGPLLRACPFCGLLEPAPGGPAGFDRAAVHHRVVAGDHGVELQLVEPLLLWTVQQLLCLDSSLIFHLSRLNHISAVVVDHPCSCHHDAGTINFRVFVNLRHTSGV